MIHLNLLWRWMYWMVITNTSVNHAIRRWRLRKYKASKNYLLILFYHWKDLNSTSKLIPKSKSMIIVSSIKRSNSKSTPLKNWIEISPWLMKISTQSKLFYLMITTTTNWEEWLCILAQPTVAIITLLSTTTKGIGFNLTMRKFLPSISRNYHNKPLVVRETMMTVESEMHTSWSTSERSKKIQLICYPNNKYMLSNRINNSSNKY